MRLTTDALLDVIDELVGPASEPPPRPARRTCDVLDDIEAALSHKRSPERRAA